jgi:adenosylcobinamide kinase / adenosylcobinamide-phosphate guanylyltransferase
MPIASAPETPHLILGGAKSGKSAHAEALVGACPTPYIYVATAQVLDEEMAHRVREHQKRRENRWETVASPLELVKTLRGLEPRQSPVLVDCLTLWLSNLLLGTPESPPEEAVKELVSFIETVGYPLFLVSNEVGGGIVPDNALARQFRDLAGFANQRVAAACRRVTLVVAGLPLPLK